MTALRSRRFRMIGLAAVLGAVLAGAAIYGIAAQTGNTTACAADPALLARLKPLATGEVAAVVVPDSPRAVPALAFQDGSGAPKTLADFKGKTLLLNIWATWCVPCRKEMPTLDALQKQLGGEDFEVVAVSLDLKDTGKPKRFFDEVGVKSLAFYADPTAKLFQQLKTVGRAVGMPTTLLLDRSGCEIGYLPGPAEWASPDAVELVTAAIGKKPAAAP